MCRQETPTQQVIKVKLLFDSDENSPTFQFVTQEEFIQFESIAYKPGNCHYGGGFGTTGDCENMNSDEIAGKNHLVVILGLEKASWGYVILMISAFSSIYLLYNYEIIQQGALLSLLALPIALYFSYKVVNNYNTRELAIANWATIGIHLITGILLIIGVNYI